MQYILLPTAVFERHTSSAEYNSKSTLRPAHRLEQDFLCGMEECYINLVWDETMYVYSSSRPRLTFWNVTYRPEASIAIHLPTAHRNIRRYSTVSTLSISDINL
jgi:hypothetical protein